MNPEEMQPDPVMPPDVGEYIEYIDAGSNRQVLGDKLWWMIAARQVLRRWPSRKAIEHQAKLRKAEMNEDLRIHVARRRLGGDQ